MSTSGDLQIRRLREPKTVVESIVDWLRIELVRGHLKPGDRLPPEEVLARRLGVGRTSLREALKVLTALGVVEVKRGQGTSIAERPGSQLLAPLSFGLILHKSTGPELLQLRKIIELGSVEYVVRGATSEDIARIGALAEEFAEAVARGANLEDLADADVAFHKAVLRATQNPLLIMVGSTVLELFHASMRVRLSEAGGAQLAAGHHFRIAEAVAKRDEKALREVTEESLAIWSETL